MSASHWVIVFLLTLIFLLGDLTDIGELFEKKAIRAVRWWKRFKSRMKRELREKSP